ncbi:NAD(P)H-flavin reductase [Psychrosphaera saromensis]|uniref:NAD(P)H-flavin reductase n=1 Tax=Psychrosphaera saromensis TaxID=716813 RepID=A0A2S7UTL6_9GAMM|nr:NAD(P)H-flavin reductase [Psychrosphaera saromensis]PQJ52620.1 NAD(P)H-flavin reductase [Psychrosphaera saromensis]GHB69908.1 NAD(P)H-flavin reductase [Psychrosphaera saromensis]GLQ13093.1 NAD(P)H-flavin reductase [Psychrosphaera saromensis]
MPQTILAEVVSIEAATDFVNIVKLKPLIPAPFKAGQYLQIVLSDEDKRIFSIASAPNAELIELHIGAGPDDAYPRGALDHMSVNREVILEVGLGDAFLQHESTRPIILMAGGTGFSYTKSIADHLVHIESVNPVILYWGVKDETALYAKTEMETWAASYPNLQFIPVVENPSADWQGKTGFVHKAVMDDIASLAEYDIYLAGPFKMAGIARDDFIKHGAIKEHLYADAFAFI